MKSMEADLDGIKLKAVQTAFKPINLAKLCLSLVLHSPIIYMSLKTLSTLIYLNTVKNVPNKGYRIIYKDLEYFPIMSDQIKTSTYPNQES